MISRASVTTSSARRFWHAKAEWFECVSEVGVALFYLIISGGVKYLSSTSRPSLCFQVTVWKDDDDAARCV